MNFEQSNDSTMKRTIMFDDSLTNIIASSLELVRTGQSDLRQTETFGPLFMRRRKADRP